MKPMSLTSPEAVAQQYGGNKQKIAEAARLGLVNPTVAVMAGMFIDKMRSAAVAEQNPSSTVAQDVLGGGVQALPQAQGAQQAQPTPQPTGIPGAQMAAQMPQQQAAPQPQPQGAPGIEALPAGDVGNYAGGGMVALAGGGTPPLRDTDAYGPLTTQEARDWFSGAAPVDESLATVDPRLFYAKRGPLAGERMRAALDQQTAEARGGVGDLAEARNAVRGALDAPVDTSIPIRTAQDALPRIGPRPENLPPPPAPRAVKTDKYGIPLPNAEANLEIAQGQVDKLLPAPKAAMDTEGALAEQEKMFETLGVNKDLYKQQREKLESERKGLQNDRQEAMHMRLIEAGLGIMAGESPHAFVNIGKGATPAMQGLAQDIKDVKKADKELTRAQMALETSENQFKIDRSKGALDRVSRDQERFDKANQARATATASIASSMNQLAGTEYSARLHDLGTRYAANTAAGASRYATDKEARELKAVMDANPGMNILDAMQEVGQAKHPKDVYNALSTRVASAVKLQELDSDLYMSRMQLQAKIKEGKKPGDKEYDEIAKRIKDRTSEINRSVGVDDDAIALLRKLEASRTPGARAGANTSGDSSTTPAAPPAAATPPAGKFSTVAPDGKTYSFDTKEQLDAFKKRLARLAEEDKKGR